MITKNLVYLSYGSTSEYNRTIFSLLSFCAWGSDYLSTTRIIVYTDAPDFFKKYLENLEIEFYFLNEQLLEAMSGPDNFIHRRKVFVIGLTAEKYPDVDQLFVDSDTFFISRADELFAELKRNESFMHLREYRLEEAAGIFKTFNQEHFPVAFMGYIKNREFDLYGNRMLFNGTDYSWNSGVLGLSRSFFKYIPDVIKLTDVFFASSKWFISEQLAFSLILQRTTQIKPADSFIFHYWGKRQKALMDKLLQHYLNQYIKGGRDIRKVKSTTKNFRKKNENDLILEQIEIAKSTGSWIYAGKKILRFALNNKLRVSSYKELLKSLRNTKMLS